MGEGRKARGSRAVLSNRNFVLLWWGEIFSRIGDGISQIALIWLVLEMTGSGAAVGTVVAVYTAAALLFGLPGGALADRWNRKKLMILSGIFSALFVAMIPILYTSLGLSIPLLAGLVFLLSTASQFFEPALDATIPNIVPESQLMSANALKMTTRQLGQLLGPALGGVLIGAIGIANVLYLDALSFLIMAGAVLLARLPPSQAGERIGLKRLITDIGEGLSFVKGQRVLLSVIIMAIVANLAFGPLSVVSPLFVKNDLQAGPEGFGYLMSSFGLGALAGMLLLGALGGKPPKGKVIIAGFALSGMAAGLTGLTSELYQTLIFFFFLGVGVALVNVPFLTLEQLLSPDRLRGKVLSTDRTLSMAATPVSQAGAGFIVEWIGTRPFFGILSGVLLACAIAGMAIRDLRKAR
ncbi:MFS transporter [Candidatus Bipolaricaulota bacterium]|nr:MFS transporter [Candidatus Bipolaricaulota bacterium]